MGKRCIKLGFMLSALILCAINLSKFSIFYHLSKGPLDSIHSLDD